MFNANTSITTSVSLTTSNNFASFGGIIGFTPDTLSTPHGDISFKDLVNLLRAMKEILLIVEEKREKLDFYPALKEAFDDYNVIRSLFLDGYV